MEFVKEVYGVTDGWPKEELYGLTLQVRRAAVSVPSNIAEGKGRGTPRSFLKHLGVAYGSLMEVETQLLIAKGRRYVSEEMAEQLLSLASEVGRLINGLASAVRSEVQDVRLTADS
jgi:four helix bundle protein